MRYATLLVSVVAVASLAGCPQQRSGVLWGGEFDTPEGIVVKYAAHGRTINGYSTGRPVTVVLIRYQRGGADTPKFDWQCTTTAEGDSEFRVGGTLVQDGIGSKGTGLLVNGSDGRLRSIEVPWGTLAELFRRDASPSRAQLLDYWDRVVRPALARSEHQ
jgi:hypothetical protein